MRDIEKHKIAKHNWYIKNKEKSQLRNRTGSQRMREKNRLYIIEAKKKPCSDCGVSYPSYVMDFDHIDQNFKFSNVSNMVYCYGFKKLVAEIAKCDIVCANCHRARTHKRNQYRSSRKAIN